MFIKTQLTTSASLTQTVWTQPSLLAECAYQNMTHESQVTISNGMPSKLRQRHLVMNMRPEDPKMRH